MPVYGRTYALKQVQPDFEVLKKIAIHADNRGYDSIWIPDHLVNPVGSYPGGKEMRERWYQGCFESWTTLSALSTITSRVRLSNIVLCNLFRYPSLLAKMVSTLDLISNGRVNLAIGVGWFRGECKAYGIPWKPYKKRFEMLRESIQLIKKLWTEEEATFKGRYYSLDRAILNPKPIQKPHPPIIVGGASENIMKLVAEEADGWDTQTPLEVFQQRIVKLEEYCSEIGKDVKSIRISRQATSFLAKSTSEAKEHAKIWAEYSGIDLQQFISSGGAWIGTAEDIISQAERWFEAGVDVISLLLPHNIQYVERFTEEIAPLLH